MAFGQAETCLPVQTDVPKLDEFVYVCADAYTPKARSPSRLPGEHYSTRMHITAVSGTSPFPCLGISFEQTYSLPAVALPPFFVPHMQLAL